jgi:hypothetical protein
VQAICARAARIVRLSELWCLDAALTSTRRNARTD